MFALKPATLVFVAAALMVGCGAATPTANRTDSPPATQAPATQTPAGQTPVTPSPVTRAAILAVARGIVPGPSPDAHPCSNTNIATCPVTPRLANRIVQLSQPSANGPGPINLWCRCQNPGEVAMTADVTPSGGTAHVVFGNAIRVDFIMVEQSGNLLLDDTRCTNRDASTSIYSTQLSGCG
jgi:hypothetical protein